MKEPTGAGKPLADAIAAETARRDLTQEEAAKLLKTTQQTFGKWVNGRTRPSDEMLPALSTYLGMTEDKIRELRGPMRVDARDRMLLRTRVEHLERVSADLVETLRRIEGRLGD